MIRMNQNVQGHLQLQSEPEAILGYMRAYLKITQTHTHRHMHTQLLMSQALCQDLSQVLSVNVKESTHQLKGHP